MKVKIISAVILIVFSIGQLRAQNPNPDASVDNYIEGEMDLEKFPGLATIIVKDGAIVWLQSYGFADVANNIPMKDSSVFLLASLSKLFTGTAVMIAQEQGFLNINKDINQYINFDIEVPGYENDSITMKRLMTHSASIKDGNAMSQYYGYPDPTISLTDCIERYFTTGGVDYNATDNFYNLAPETQFNYSNMGTALSGFTTQSATGIAFDDFCDSNIFAPLCMENTAWHFSDFDSAQVARPHNYQGGNYSAIPHYGFADYPDGQLRSNVLDLGNFMIAMLNNGSIGSNQLLENQSVNEMLSSQIPTIDTDQGLNWHRQKIYHNGDSTILWGHSGAESGVSTNLYIDAENSIGICVLANGAGNSLYICDKLYEYGLSLNSSANHIDTNCGLISGIENASAKQSEVVKIFDLLGREVELKSNTPLIKVYENGHTEKVMILE